MEKFANRLYEALNIRGMKQIELAQKCGIGKSSISQWLSGRSKPNSENVYKLAKALDVEEAWLMGYENIPMKRTPEAERIAQSLTLEQQMSEMMLNKVIELFHSLEFNQQVHLFEVIRKEEQKLETTK